ncbi:AcrR family transcriptional regulator [Nakamurella sp. UYEF19]|uniref:TetR/AcrR family transcriptional regulator n=1 Tax=Nakamurella sp. UYEF19 TaxID=1756392 RepID=UPI0033917874
MSVDRLQPPTTQQRRTQVSREKILDAAVRCLVEFGYAGASTLKIQELAGVSRGRLLYHFASRDLLLIGAVHHLAAGRVIELGNEATTIIRVAQDDPARIDQAVARVWLDFHQPYFWAEMELWIAARHSEELRAALGPSERVLYQSIYGTVDALFGPVFSTRSSYQQVREILLSSMRGVALAYTFRNRVPAADPHLVYWVKMARELLSR